MSLQSEPIMTSCSIKLSGNTYEIKCPAGEEKSLQRAAEKINEQLTAQKKKYKHLDQYQALLLASLHISHELVNCQQQQNHLHKQVSEFIKTLENKPQYDASLTEIDPLIKNDA